MESLVSDIPAGDGKIVNLFLQCSICTCTMGFYFFLMQVQILNTLMGRAHNSVSRTVSATLKYLCEFKTFIRHQYVDNKELQPYAKLLREIKRRQKSHDSFPLMLHCFRLLAVSPGARGAGTLCLV